VRFRMVMAERQGYCQRAFSIKPGTIPSVSLRFSEN
jgi:hypothetical protein